MTISIHTHLHSDTVHLPEAAELIGKDVHIIVVEEPAQKLPKDLSVLDRLAGKIDMDWDAIEDLRRRECFVILIDTSVLVAYLRKPSPAVRIIFASLDCAVCGITRAEILHGARSPADVVDITALLNSFIQIPISETTWDRIGNHLVLLRSDGIALPFQDVALATVAIESNAQIWSYDTHFRMMQIHLPSLQLFDGPV